LIPSTLKKTCFMVSGITQFVEVCKCYFWAIPNVMLPLVHAKYPAVN